MPVPIPGSMAEFAPTQQIDDGGTAFPQAIAEIHGIATHSGEFGSPGMSLRDYFAATALRGMLTDVRIAQLGKPLGGEPVEQFYAEGAYKFADAMLAERRKRHGA